MKRYVAAMGILLLATLTAAAQISAEDRKAVAEEMKKATEKLGENQQRALKNIATKGGFTERCRIK